MKIKKILGASILTGAILFNTVSATTTSAAKNSDRETIAQVALLQSLALGYFDGTVSVRDLKKLGDTGIGTFEGLDGEMIVLDGVVYRANQNCRINVVADKVTVPFSNVTFFEEDNGGMLYDYSSKSLVEEALNDIIKDLDDIKDGSTSNRFYMLKLHGNFNSIQVRSEAKQYKPYPTLVGALQATQKEFTFENISGTIVGLYCPDFMSSLNTPGWHFHFISDDKKVGGHVLELNLKDGAFALDKTDGFRMVLPTTTDFHKLNFKTDLREDIRKAENDSTKGA